MKQNGFINSKLNTNELNDLKNLSLRCKADILAMTTLAASGHPGGSMSSVDMYLTLFKFANLFTDNPQNPDRDRIIVSHGHTSPGVYSYKHQYKKQNYAKRRPLIKVCIAVSGCSHY